MKDQIAEFCCGDMKGHVESESLHLHYDPKLREYGIRYADDGISIQVIHYCPWCGNALPESLREAWFNELDALGIDPDGEIPALYQTSAWWRNVQKS